MQFFASGRKINGHVSFSNGSLRPHNHASGIPKSMDTILSKFPQAHAFIDDILVVTKGTEVEHISAVEKNLRNSDRENMSLRFTKCQFAPKECEWLGHKITCTGITPLIRKTEPIESLKAPETVSHLKSFMGSNHSLHKYLPALAESSTSLRPLLSRKNEYIFGLVSVKYHSRI